MEIPSFIFLALEALLAGDVLTIFSDPFFVLVLILIGFMVGTAIGASGLGGAPLLLPSLVFLGIPPQIVIGADLAFISFTKIFATILHGKERNINWRASLYLVIAVVPAMLLASWLWLYVKDNHGSEVLDSLILLMLGVVLIGLAAYMLKDQVLRKLHTKISLANTNDGSQTKTTLLRTSLSRGDKATLLSTGGFVSFIIQITATGAGAILLPVLVKMLRSPRHAAGTSVISGLVMAGVGASLHYTLGNVPIYLVALLLIGSLPGVMLGVRIASTVSPRKLILIFTAIIFWAAIFLLNKGIGSIL